MDGNEVAEVETDDSSSGGFSDLKKDDFEFGAATPFKEDSDLGEGGEPDGADKPKGDEKPAGDENPKGDESKGDEKPAGDEELAGDAKPNESETLEGEKPEGDEASSSDSSLSDKPGVDDAAVTQQIESTLQELSGGTINNAEELKAELQELESLRQEKANPKEPEFENKAKQRLWSFVQKHGDGTDPKVANTYLNLMQIDASKLDGREVLFQEFKIENPDVEGERAKAIWEEMNEDYSEDALEGSELKKYEFEKKVKEAREKITTMQSEFQEGQPKEEEPSVEQVAMEVIRNDIKAQVKSYEGTSLSFTKGADGTFELAPADPSKPVGNFTMKLSAEDLQNFEEQAISPEKLWSELVKFDDKGVADYGTYFDVLNYAKDPQAFKTNLYSFAYNQGKIANEKAAKNIDDEKPLPGGGNNTEGVSDVVQSIRDNRRSA